MINKFLISLILLLVFLVPASVSAAGDIKLVSSSTKIDFPTLTDL